MSSETYVSGQLLGSYLSKLNYEASVYIGRPPFTKPDNVVRLKVAPHERVCVGGPGLVLSVASLVTLVSMFNSQETLDLSSLIKNKLTSSSTPSMVSDCIVQCSFVLTWYQPHDLCQVERVWG